MVRPETPSSERASSERVPATKRARVEDLSEALLGLAAKEQEGLEPGPGEVKCPICGAVVRATKNRRVRKHPSNPLRPDEPCAASGKGLKALEA